MSQTIRVDQLEYKKIYPRLTLQLPTSVNHMYVNRLINGRRTRVYSDEARGWADHAIYLTHIWKNKLRIQKPIEGKIIINIWFYFRDNRFGDTHNGLKILLDSLEHARVYDNDKYVLPRIIDYDFDKKNPRIELEIIEVSA